MTTEGKEKLDIEQNSEIAQRDALKESWIALTASADALQDGPPELAGAASLIRAAAESIHTQWVRTLDNLEGKASARAIVDDATTAEDAVGYIDQDIEKETQEAKGHFQRAADLIARAAGMSAAPPWIEVQKEMRAGVAELQRIEGKKKIRYLLKPPKLGKEFSD